MEQYQFWKQDFNAWFGVLNEANCIGRTNTNLHQWEKSVPLLMYNLRDVASDHNMSNSSTPVTNIIIALKSLITTLES